MTSLYDFIIKHTVGLIHETEFREFHHQVLFKFVFIFRFKDREENN